MLKFVTKKMYWDAIDNGAEAALRKNVLAWHLKSIQDTIVMNVLKEIQGQSIAEIGGGDTRILPNLAKKNTVYNIDKFEGADNGPKKKIRLRKVKNIHAFVGESQGVITDNSFDIVFSVSVVEHIPSENLPGFIEDCARILKPGGLMLHVVDSYLPEPDYMHKGGRYTKFLDSRMALHRSAFEAGLFSPLEPPEINEISDIRFNPALVSNPDNVMREWNMAAPALASLREHAQGATFLWAGRKI